MFRARIVKTYNFHRITIKAPDLLRRWHLDSLIIQVLVVIKNRKADHICVFDRIYLNIQLIEIIGFI
jgi:hypothetical protein